MSRTAADPVAGHEAFRSALLALAHPGRRFALPAQGLDGLHGLLWAIFEPATPSWAAQADLLPWPMTADATVAQLVVVDGGDSRGVLERAPRGSELHPARGATVVYVAGRAAAPATVALTGPGVDGRLECSLALAPGELAARERACGDPPRGVDVLLVDDEGRVRGLPRTTRVEVLG
jgi:alpha-D-ribose 1-methylphosphonate 5-triphosphate synthase subunit PhnH